MKKLKIRELKPEDIDSEVQNTKEEIRKMRFQYAVSRSLENTKSIRNAKKKIARLLTVKRERELGINQKKK